MWKDDKVFNEINQIFENHRKYYNKPKKALTARRKIFDKYNIYLAVRRHKKRVKKRYELIEGDSYE